MAMVDNLVGVARCGHNSLALNTFINTQIELKKLRFHTPDERGKSKCNVMHVGKDMGICPSLQVHGTTMQKITHDKYLGDILSSDGKNDLNIESRISKGLGIVTQITNMLEKVSFGKHYFKMARLFRESNFLNGILTNAESWHGLSPTQVNQLESVDQLLMRNFFDTTVSTPVEALYLELGVISIGTIIKARRINFLHYLVSSSENEMVYNVFQAQWNRPVKNDWTLYVKQDLKDFQMECSLDNVKAKSAESFKNLVKRKANEYEFRRLMSLKQSHTKLDNLCYTKLEMQEYLKLEKIDKVGAQTLFRY